MALTQEAVDEFIAASKVVARPRSIAWRVIGIDLLRWDAQTEVEAVTRGRLWMSFNRATGAYSFNLQLQGVSVLGWHFRPYPGKHRNPKCCGSDFPAKVRYSHEQVWIEGCGFNCVRPLEGMDGMTHREHFERFCERASIEFRPTYTRPEMAEQLTIDGEIEGEDEP